MKKLTLLGLAGLLCTSLSAQELPEVNQEDMHWLMFGKHPEGPCMTLGYDTDGDKFEDTRFHYLLTPLPSGAMMTQLDSYAVDENRDGYFTNDEWFKNVQPIKSESRRIKHGR